MQIKTHLFAKLFRLFEKCIDFVFSFININLTRELGFDEIILAEK